MPVTERGFTCHEHMEDFGLINMNGRIYDPLLGRFLSVDPLIQDATSTQNFNSYSYCINNPLKYSDPSGYTRYPYEERTFEQYAFPNASGGNSSFISGTGSRFLDFYLMSSAFRHEGATICYRGSTFRYDPENDIFVSSNGHVLSSNHYAYDWRTGEYRNPMGQKATFREAQAKGITPYISGKYVYHWSAVGVILTDPVDGYKYPGWKKTREWWEYIPECVTSSGEVTSWLNYSNNSINTGAFIVSVIGGSMRFMKGGSLSFKYYASAWNGGSRAKITTYNLTKLGVKIGQGASIATAGFGTINFMLSDKSWGDYGRLGISYLSAGLTYFPEPITTGFGIGIGFIDTAGGFNGFYNYLDFHQQLYHSTGGIILPLNGIPQYMPIKR